MKIVATQSTVVCRSHFVLCFIESLSIICMKNKIALQLGHPFTFFIYSWTGFVAFDEFWGLIQILVYNMYDSGNYLEFYSAIKEAYPDIKIISNCDGSSKALDHPADLYDFHVRLWCCSKSILQSMYIWALTLFTYVFKWGFNFVISLWLRFMPVQVTCGLTPAVLMMHCAVDRRWVKMFLLMINFLLL